MRRSAIPLCCALALGSTAIACVEVSPFQCSGDEDCRSRGAEGACEDVGYCSYPDAECAPQRRFSELAGPFAGQCTPDATGTSSSGDSAASSTALADTTDGGSSSSGGPAVDPYCGDGSVDADLGEECDDGNAVGGDGCSIDCTRSGALVWSRIYESSGSTYMYDLALLNDETFVIVGASSGDGSIGGYATVDGEPQWEAAPVADDPVETAYGVVVQEGLIYAAVEAATLTSTRAGVYCYEPDGAHCGHVLETSSLRRGNDIARRDDGAASNLVVAAHSFTRPGAFEVEVIDFAVAEFDHPRQSPRGQADRMLTVAAVDGTAFVAGAIADRMWVGTFDVVLSELWSDADPQSLLSGVQALGTDGSGLILGGYLDAMDLADVVRRPVLARLEVDGTLTWLESDEDARGEIEGLWVDADGTIFTAGFASAPAPVPWVAKWNAAGALIWQRTYEELQEGESIARAIARLADGDILVVGERGGPGPRAGFAARISD